MSLYSCPAFFTHCLIPCISSLPNLIPLPIATYGPIFTYPSSRRHIQLLSTTFRQHLTYILTLIYYQNPLFTNFRLTSSTHHYIIKNDFNMTDHFQHGRLPPTTLFFPSRLSTTFPAYFFTLTYHSLYLLGHIHHGKPIPTRPRHRWIPPTRENIQLFKSRLSTTFLGYLCRMVDPRDPITTRK